MWWHRSPARNAVASTQSTTRHQQCNSNCLWKACPKTGKLLDVRLDTNPETIGGGVQDVVAQAAADEALAVALSQAHHQEAQAMAYKVTPTPSINEPILDASSLGTRAVAVARLYPYQNPVPSRAQLATDLPKRSQA